MLKNVARALFLTIFFVTPVVSAAGAPAIRLGEIHPQGLTLAQAKRVLVFVLKHEGYSVNKPGVFIEDLVDNKGNSSLPGYFQFSLGYDNPKAAALEYSGLYAVSVSSGETWEIHQCKTFSFPALQRVQRQIRAKTKKTAQEERVLRRGLGCTDS
jgi:hypothetical protein